MKFIITGDTHGAVLERLNKISHTYDLSEYAVIILGDAGLNFYLDDNERRIKKKIKSRVYCVRGNHEERPENLNYKVVWDEDVYGNVYMDPDNENIRYFLDGGEYILGEYSVLTLGGAYSVDKCYRLERAKILNLKFSGWFANEQLTPEEMETINKKVFGKRYDFILSHTCPIAWEPTDLFLGFIDQSTVDKSMENWLDEVRKNIDWKYYLFGHYHADRVERPHVEQFYQKYEALESIVERWKKYDETDELDWWMPKNPNFNLDNNK